MAKERKKEIEVGKVHNSFAIHFVNGMRCPSDYYINCNCKTIFLRYFNFSMSSNYQNLEMIESFRFKMKISQQKMLEK